MTKKNDINVNRLIDRYGYYAYWVKLNKSMKCECINPSTKEPMLYVRSV